MNLFPHQIELLERTRDFENAGYFVDMGLGKTFIGSEKMREIGNACNLLVCQKSKIEDWIEHFKTHYQNYRVYDLTKKKNLHNFLIDESWCVGVINYELLFRRPEIKNIGGYTLVLDESSLIQNEHAQRSDFILTELDFSNVILLSGTVVNGNYEKLWSQCNLLNWSISKKLFERQFMIFKNHNVAGMFYRERIGYKNIDRLKNKLKNHGAVFMKTDEVFDLPEQNFIHVAVDTTPEYRKFVKTGADGSIVEVEDRVLIGDMQLKKRLYQRLLCGAYCSPKLNVFRDLVESTDDRLIVFYNFNEELNRLHEIAVKNKRECSFVNGEKRDLTAYEKYDDSITFVQYQAGAMGLNLQKANKIIYFSLPDGESELFEQSKKRIHRIGQSKPCFYYVLFCKNSIEDLEIMPNLEDKRKRIDELFERG